MHVLIETKRVFGAYNWEKETWEKWYEYDNLADIMVFDGIVCSAVSSGFDGDKAMESVNKTTFATFAGGCFWGTEYAYEKVPGVIKTEVGFMGGKTDDPSYKQVCVGNTNHAEVVHLEFDPAKVSYRKLVEYFFKDS